MTERPVVENETTEKEKLTETVPEQPETAAEKPEEAAKKPEETAEKPEETAAEPEGAVAEPETVSAPSSSKKQKPKRKHKKKNYPLRIVIVLAVLCAAFLCAHLSYFDVDGIAVIGNEEVTDEEIVKLSGVETGVSLFDVHPLLVQHKIKQNLYIEKVNVNRKLPNKVEIIVKERNLLAQFRKDDKFVITDQEGMVLDISKEEHKATLIEGVTVTGAEKKDTIKIKENQGLERALELISLTDENDLYFKRIVFDKGKVDAYIYDGLKCSGRYDNLISAISSGTLKKVIYDLYQKGVEKGTVNVYNNDYCFFTPN